MDVIPMIEVKNLSYHYPGHQSENQLVNINFQIQKGAFVLLTGESGCGKSTLLSCINGLSTQLFEGRQEGEIMLCGESLVGKSAADIGEKIGTVFQNPRSQFFTTDTEDEVAFGLENMRLPKKEIRERMEKAFRDLHLEHLRGRSIFELSSGEKQLIAISSIYAMSPEVILLDEPSANLDTESIGKLVEILRELKKKGKTILVVEHRFHYLRELVDEVIFMELGRISNIYRKSDLSRVFEHGIEGKWEKTYSGVRIKTQMGTNPEHILEMKGLSFSYEKKKPILSEISLTARSGDLIGIRGRCGSGKTTLASIIAGLRSAEQGSITFDGTQFTEKMRLKQSYFVLQDSDYQLFSDSVKGELQIGNRKKEKLSEKEVLGIFGLEDKESAHPMSLSRGQKQRLTIAAGLFCTASIFILDEPTSGLDKKNRRVMEEVLRELARTGKIVFVISHDEELLSACCSRVINMGGNVK